MNPSPTITQGPTTHVIVGLVLNPCFGVLRSEGIFLTLPRNSHQLGIKPETWETLLGYLTTTVKPLSH
jgi:hypothetical protein